jgi:5-deoxy-glucuronate isomerase
MRVADLAPGERRLINTGDSEMLVLPLSGSASARSGGTDIDLLGRTDVFSGVSDFAYVGRSSTVEVHSAEGARIAFPAARCERQLPFRYGSAADVRVELRGAGSASRQVNNFCTPDTFEADRLIACEVLTPGGNWSSYPPHKHDEDRPGESVLEEIYYFEVAAGPSGGGVGFQRVYGTADRPIDVLAEVRSGDVVLVPHGWHGPSMAAPGYDLYYLNAMAGPGPRAWQICDDPSHAWVRDTWTTEAIDARLPFGSRRRLDLL